MSSVAFAPDGQRVAAAYEYLALTSIWDVKTGSQLTIIEEEQPGEHLVIEAITFSPDGKLMAVGIERLSDVGTAGTEVRMRDAYTGQLVRTLEGASAQLMAFSPDGRLFAAGRRILKMPEGHLLRQLSVPEKFWAWGTDFSPDGRLLAVSGHISGTHTHPSPIVFLFEVDTGTVVETIECPISGQHKYCSEVKGCDFHPDGKRLAIGTNTDEFYIWDMETRLSRIFAREGGRWSSVRFSPDGSLLAVSGSGGIVLVWDTKEGTELSTLKGHVLTVYALEFSPKGHLLASGGMDGKVRLWGPKGWGGKRWGLVRTLKSKHPGNKRARH